jgi:hypothetical protein
MAGELVDKRPELLTQEFVTDLCDWMANGKSVRAYCRANPDYKPSTICGWLIDYPDFKEQYARAINMRADAKFDMVDDVVEDMRGGKIDAQMARVEIDAIKWQAGKMNPKRYGDKLDLDHTSQGEKITWGLNMGGKIPLEVTQQLNLETKQQSDT